MLVNKKITTIICLLAAVTFSALTSMSADHDEHHGPKNLKVLPKKIPHELLHKVMDDWSEALGVHCNFCHAAADNGKLDFASDAKPEKEEAREMYKMTAKINAKFFEGKKDSLGMVMGDIKCQTCHRGSPHPDEVKMMDMKNHGPEMMHHDMPPMGSKPDSLKK
jgi:hypothetical protein